MRPYRFTPQQQLALSVITGTGHLVSINQGRDDCLSLTVSLNGQDINFDFHMGGDMVLEFTHYINAHDFISKVLEKLVYIVEQKDSDQLP